MNTTRCNFYVMSQYSTRIPNRKNFPPGEKILNPGN